jgi:hypothetical protein
MEMRDLFGVPEKEAGRETKLAECFGARLTALRGHHIGESILAQHQQIVRVMKQVRPHPRCPVAPRISSMIRGIECCERMSPVAIGNSRDDGVIGRIGNRNFISGTTPLPVDKQAGRHKVTSHIRNRRIILHFHGLTLLSLAPRLIAARRVDNNVVSELAFGPLVGEDEALDENRVLLHVLQTFSLENGESGGETQEMAVSGMVSKTATAMMPP